VARIGVDTTFGEVSARFRSALRFHLFVDGTRSILGNEVRAMGDGPASLGGVAFADGRIDLFRSIEPAPLSGH
jgi:hypothetical protein